MTASVVPGIARQSKNRREASPQIGNARRLESGFTEILRKEGQRQLTTSTAETLVDAEVEQLLRIAPVTSRRNAMICPRCEAQLRMNYDEPECLQCGYVNYHYTPSASANGHKSIIGSGTRRILRYVGEFPSLVETLVHARLRRVGNRVVHEVTCRVMKAQHFDVGDPQSLMPMR